jgi:hypothetical protein
MSRFIRRGWLLPLLALAAQAHVGSPDVYLDGKAGPYQLFVTIRPPVVIPGVAEIEVRAESPGVQQIRVVPLPIGEAGAQFAPVPDKLKVSPQDSQFFTGSLWMMSYGSWQVRITAAGAQGEGVLAVPVPSIALTTKRMKLGLGALLSVFGLFLIGGLVAIAGSAVREVKLDPGEGFSAADKRRGRIATVVAAVVVAAVVWAGNAWWTSEADTYSMRVYKPLGMKTALEGGVLTLKMNEPGWMQPPPRGTLTRILFVRKMDDLIPDHGHLMHLYAIREPGLDVVYHLHPDLVETGTFRLALPSMPAGNYKLYADIVHENGFPETLVSQIELPAMSGRPLTGDDATARAQSWQQTAAASTEFTLPDGYRMTWLRGNETPRAKQANLFRFRLDAPDGSAPRDMALYMGMLGHAAFVKTDGTVFAHVHPNGSASMAAVMLVQDQTAKMPANMPAMDMGGGHMNKSLPNEVSFPYGFPAPGRYRIFVQMKHGQTVETGVFDATVI